MTGLWIGIPLALKYIVLPYFKYCHDAICHIFNRIVSDLFLLNRILLEIYKGALFTISMSLYINSSSAKLIKSLLINVFL